MVGLKRRCRSLLGSAKHLRRDYARDPQVLGKQLHLSVGGWDYQGPHHSSGLGWADQRRYYSVHWERPYLCREQGRRRQVLGKQLQRPVGRWDYQGPHQSNGLGWAGKWGGHSVRARSIPATTRSRWTCFLAGSSYQMVSPTRDPGGTGVLTRCLGSQSVGSGSGRTAITGLTRSHLCEGMVDSVLRTLATLPVL